MSGDEKTTLAELKRLALEFRDRRDWEQFHDPKNLSMGLSIEAAELQELFLWRTDREVEALLRDDRGREKVRDELADVLVFLLYLSHACGIDLSEALRDKIALNEKKYPVEKSRGSHKKYDEI